MIENMILNLLNRKSGFFILESLILFSMYKVVMEMFLL